MKNPKHIFPLLIITGLALYTISLPAGFVFDDDLLILNNPAIGDLGNIPFIWKAFNTRFLTGLSLARDYSSGGLDPAHFRIVNILLHLATAILVYFFTKLIFTTPYCRSRRLTERKDTFAFFASMIFLVHPIQVESVVYISQRSTLLGGFFYVLSLVFYLKFRLTEKRRYFWGAFLATILGMFSKEMSFTIPLAIVICELFFFDQEKKEIGKTLRRLLPFIGLMAVIPLVLFMEGPYSILKVRTIFTANDFDATRFLPEINILRTY